MTLAIEGGEPTAPAGFDEEWPVYGEPERRALLDVLESGRWCSADFYFDERESRVRRLERRFAEDVGVEHAHAVPNGTQALELAFEAIGVEPGDEVIVPAVSFIASATAVTLANGVPVFVDVEPDTYQIDPDAVERAITDRTVAIEAVHYGGRPADLDRLAAVADEHDLALVEDCAQAHGTEWRGERVPAAGDVGCFSLQLSKQLNCGEGGMVVTDDDELGELLYAHKNLGRTPSGGKYDHAVPAGNYRLSEFLGALALAQYGRFSKLTPVRAENGAYLAERLDAVEGIGTIERDERVTQRGYMYFFLRFEPEAWPAGVDRDRVMAALNAEGIACSTGHNDPIYAHPAFREIDPALLHGNERDYRETECPAAERIFEEEVIVLEKDFLAERDNCDLVVAALEKLRAHADRLAAVPA